MKRLTNFKLILFTIIFIAIIFIINTYGIDNIRNEVKNLGIWAPFAIVLLRSTSIIIPALPSTAYSILVEISKETIFLFG